MKSISLFVALLAVPGVLSSCQTAEPTRAVLDNAYAVGDAGTKVTIYEGWWSVAAFFEPVPAGAESAPVRVVKGADFAYALLARGWDPEAASPPALIPVRTREKLSVKRGDTLHIRVAPDAVDGDCATGTPLSQEEADFITQRIFPGEFSGVHYDAGTCSSSAFGEGAGGAPADAATGGSGPEAAGQGGQTAP
jgi:hypothetical protein